MILGRLFTVLFDQGVVVVATSNVVPDRLYEGGLNRALFLPFIDLLSARMQVMELDARTDFRMEKLGGLPVYYTPADGQAAQAVEARPLILRPCIANNDEGRRHRETRSCKGLGVTFRFGRGRRQVKAGEPSPIGKPDVSTCVPLVIGAFTNVTGSGVQGVCGRLD